MRVTPEVGEEHKHRMNEWIRSHAISLGETRGADGEERPDYTISGACLKLGEGELGRFLMKTVLEGGSSRAKSLV